MAEITLTVDNFQTEVMKSDKPVLIDFWASWCGPCMMLAPTIAEIAEEHPEIKVCKVNVDEEDAIAASFNVTSIPLLVYMKDGKIEDTSLGLVPKKNIENMLK